MIEKEIFRLCQLFFDFSTVLKGTPLLTFTPSKEEKAFVLFNVEDVGEDMALISLKVHSPYQGLAEVALFDKEIRENLEKKIRQQGGYSYVFKEYKPSFFKVKRFKIGS